MVRWAIKAASKNCTDHNFSGFSMGKYKTSTINVLSYIFFPCKFPNFFISSCDTVGNLVFFLFCEDVQPAGSSWNASNVQPVCLPITSQGCGLSSGLQPFSDSTGKMA